MNEANSNSGSAQSETPRQRKTKATRGIFEKTRGSNVWWIRYMDAAGHYRREVAGSWSQARQLLDKRRGEALAGKKLPETLRRRMVPFTVLADSAITYIEKNYARPSDDIARLKLLKEKFTGAADGITPSQVERVLDALTEEKSWSPSTRNHHHNLVSLAYRLGIKDGLVKENPARAVQRESETGSRRVRFLTADEETKLRDTIRSKPEWAEHEPELDLAIHTGLRRSSMYTALIWQNVDLVARTLTIPRTKNGDSITIPLNGEAMRALMVFRARGDGKGRVVRNAGGETLNVNAHWFPDAVRAAGIQDFRWHDCRHTFASRLRQAGVPLGNIAELLGHKGLAMTQRYAHLSISNLHEAVSRISNSTPVAPKPKTQSAEFAYLQ
jgi:integrase